MAEFWVVVGNGSDGKSSIIRALTGVGNCAIQTVQNPASNEEWNLSYVGSGVAKTFVQAGSLQEIHDPNEPKRDWTPASAFNRVSGCADRAIFSLWSKGKLPRMDAMDYIGHFTNNGWTLRGVALINGNIPTITPALITNVNRWQITPANETAATLRSVWGIM